MTALHLQSLFPVPLKECCSFRCPAAAMAHPVLLPFIEHRGRMSYSGCRTGPAACPVGFSSAWSRHSRRGDAPRGLRQHGAAGGRGAQTDRRASAMAAGRRRAVCRRQRRGHRDRSRLRRRAGVGHGSVHSGDLAAVNGTRAGDFLGLTRRITGGQTDTLPGRQTDRQTDRQLTRDGWHLWQLGDWVDLSGGVVRRQLVPVHPPRIVGQSRLTDWIVRQPFLFLTVIATQIFPKTPPILDSISLASLEC
jgi:hypothetical protein